MLRGFALLVATGAALAGSAFVVLQLFPDLQFRRRVFAMVTAFAPYGVLLWLLAAVLVLVALRGRARLWVLPVLAGLVAQVALSWGYLPGPTPPASASTLRLASFNAYHGQADTALLAEQMAAQDADVIVLLEVGEEFMESPDVAALLADHPHRAGIATPRGLTPINTVVAARRPLELVGRSAWTSNHLVLATTTADDRPITVIAGHPANMTRGVGRWRHDASDLAEDVRAHIAEPLVVIGDLNTTREGATYRMITEPGLVNAAQQSGAGWQPTFSGSRLLPALIAIDHALVNDQVVANRFSTFAVPGSDHHAIVVDVSLRDGA